MFDKDTLIISYDEKRGDPRGSRKRKADPKTLGLGDCIDCTLCVQVCPTGIDIRNGLQYQCIGCAACIDVCDEVMDKMGYPKGLVRYTTEHAMAGVHTNIIRPRTIMYTVLLAALTVGLFYAISQRTPLELDIIRDRNSLYRETANGLVENVYILKVVNMDEQAHRYSLAVSGLEGMELVLADPIIEVSGGEVLTLPASVRVDPIVLKRAASEIEFTISAHDNATLTRVETARFLGPAMAR
jgi:cytochrome c oxidase accessory protein FixG